MIEKSFKSVKARFNVRGIGVADKYITSICAFNDLIFSFCLTPNLCSSSIIKRPTLLKSNLLFINA